MSDQTFLDRVKILIKTRTPLHPSEMQKLIKLAEIGESYLKMAIDENKPQGDKRSFYARCDTLFGLPTPASKPAD